MELDVTEFFNNAAPMDHSASVAEIGHNAGPDTWRAACEDSKDYPLLQTDEQREAFRAYLKGFGAWSVKEIAAWTDTELNALCIQMVAGDMREADFDVGSEAEWAEYQAQAESGRVSGRLCRNDDGRIYYFIGD